MARLPILLLLIACDGASVHDAGRLDGARELDGSSSADAGRGSDDGGEVDAGPPDVREPRYVGRHVIEGDGAVRFSWPGTGAVVRFRGTALRATLDGAAQFFTVVIDGEAQPTLAVSGGEESYTLASGLSDAEHTVELYRRTEGLFGPTVLRAIEVDGELLGVPAPLRSMEVIGDSISAGYGVDGADESCSFSAATENHYLTYGAVAGRALGAELSTVAWSGKGVVHNYGTDTFEPLPELYDRVIASEDASTGTIRSVDAVVINLGTNDFSTEGDPTSEVFTPAYVALLEAVRAQHPDAMILCTIAPLLSGDDGARATSYIQAAIATRNAAGDARVRWIDLGGAELIDDWGCDYHPGDRTQAAMGARLVTALEVELGW